MGHKDNLKNQTVIGIKWTVIGNWSKLFIQYIITIILIRQLSPETFGLIGMVLVFSEFGNLLSNFGFGSALIQKNDINEKHKSSVFWTNVLIGIGFSLIFFFLSEPISIFYSEVELISIIRVVGLKFIFDAISIVHKALLKKDLLFKKISIIDLTTVFITGIIAISLTYFGYGVWSLVTQIILSSMISSILYWIFSNWKPQFIYSFNSIIDLSRFGMNLLGFNVVNYWMRKGDNLLIGKFLGSIELGLYTRAYSIIYLPLSQFSSVLGQVMFPSFSKIKEDKERIKSIYLKLISIIALFSFPMMVGLFLTANEFVITVFGENWNEIIPITQIFCIVGLIQSLGSPAGTIFLSQGKTDKFFRWNILASIVILICFGLGIYKGTIFYVAFYYAIGSTIILFFPSFLIPAQLINMELTEILKALSGVISCTIIMSISLILLKWVLVSHIVIWEKFLIQIVIGSAIYIFSIQYFHLSPYIELRTIIKCHLFPK